MFLGVARGGACKGSARPRIGSCIWNPTDAEERRANQMARKCSEVSYNFFDVHFVNDVIVPFGMQPLRSHWLRTCLDKFERSLTTLFPFNHHVLLSQARPPSRGSIATTRRRQEDFQTSTNSSENRVGTAIERSQGGVRALRRNRWRLQGPGQLGLESHSLAGARLPSLQ